MANYWNIVNNVIRKADVLLLVLDTRQPDETRHPEIEEKIRSQKKQLLYVLNKCDLVSGDRLKEIAARLKPNVYVSCTKFYGATKLRHAILRYSSSIAKQYGRDKIFIGVLGFPNVGKSSVINLLKGKGSAGTSPEAGFTRGYQFIKISDKVFMIDTPGVLSGEMKEENEIARIGAMNSAKIKDPDLVAVTLIEELEGTIERHYSIDRKPGEDAEEILERIAKKQNCLRQGGKPDIDRMARKIIQDWQYGKIRVE